MSVQEIPTMLSIAEAADRTGLPRHYVRQLVLQGKIVYISSGKKYFVNLNSLVAFLYEGERNENRK